MHQISLNLDIKEVNVIIKSLSACPFREVYELIGKIHAQANTQLTNPDLQLDKTSKIQASHP